MLVLQAASQSSKHQGKIGLAIAGGGPIGEIVYFEEKDGKVTRMYAGDGWSERVNNY